MSRLRDAEMPLALADCSFDELIPDTGLTSNEVGKRLTTATSFSRVATLSLRDPGQKQPAATLLPDRLPPSHASSIIYAPTSTLIVARAIHHDARAGPYLHLTFFALPTPNSTTSRARADASLQVPLPAPAVDSIGLCIDSGAGDRNLLHVFILTHGAQLFQLSIPLASVLTHGLNVRRIQRRVDDLSTFLSPAPAWAASSEEAAGTTNTMALVLGQKQVSRGRAAIQCMFTHSRLALIACEDGSLISLRRDDVRKAAWQETNLKPTSFLNTLARLLPRASTAPSTTRAAGGVASTQLPEPTATFEPTQILALDSFDNEATFALAFAISRDRKLRIWGLTSEQCLHQLELPRKRPDLSANDAGFGARAIARRALRLRGGAANGDAGGREGSVAPSSVTGSAAGGGSPKKAPSEYSTATAAFQAGAVFGAAGLSGSADGAGSGGGVSLPRIRVEEAPDGSPYSLFALVFVPVPATPAQARAESFFIFYGIRLSHTNDRGQESEEVVHSITPLWSCAAADEGEDEAAGLAAVPALRALRLQSLSTGERDGGEGARGWTLWTAWNTLAGPEVRKTHIPVGIDGKIIPAKPQDAAAPSLLTQEEVIPPIWTSVSMFPCPSSPTSSMSARARFQPLHGPSFQHDLARAVEYESKSVAEFFVDRIFEPGRFDLRNLAKAADWYGDVQKKTGRGKEPGADSGIIDGAGPGPSGARGDSARCQATALKNRLLSLIGSDLRPQRDAATGALVQDEFEGLLIREWVKFIDRAEHEEDAARFVVGFVEGVVCSDEPAEDADGPQSGEQSGAAELAWASQNSDPIMIIANNRIGVPIAELPVETLLRIASQAATEELSLFTSQSGEDYSIDIKESKRFQQSDIVSLAAATSDSALIPLEDPTADEAESETSSRLQCSRLLAGLAALGLSVPRTLASSTAGSVLEALRHADGQDQGRIFNDAIQDAWITSCELYYADALHDLEEDLRSERVDIDDEAQDANPEFEQHLAQGRSDIVEDTSRLVGEWVKGQLFSVDEVVGDEANAVDQRMIIRLEQALWLWLDLMSGPSLSAPAQGEGIPKTNPVTETAIGAVLTADGAERSLQARRRLAHAMLVVLLSLQRSAFFNPASGDAEFDGERDDPFAMDLVDVPRRTDKIIPSLPLLLSTLLSMLQRIEALYGLTAVSARPEADPRKLLVAAEMERKQNFDQLREEETSQDADEFEDISFDRTVTRLGNMTVQADRQDDAEVQPVSKPASFRNLFHYAVNKQAVDASLTDAYSLAIGDAPALSERISNAASGILSYNGLLGLYLPSAVWIAVDDRSVESQNLYYHGGVTGSAVFASTPRFEAPQAQFGRALFNLGFPSAVISYITVFSEGKSSAISYLTARAFIATGRFQAAESCITSVASSLRKLASDLTRALTQRELRRHRSRPAQHSPDDWDHADPGSEEGHHPPPDPDAEEMNEDADDEESFDPYDEDQKGLMSVLPQSVTAAIEAHSAIPAVAVELYYRHLIDVLLESENSGDLLIKVCTAAIESNAEVEAVIVDEEQAQLYRIDPEVEPPTLHTVERLWTHLFGAQVALGRFVDAYATLLRIPLNDLQTRCLRQLVTVMCEQGQSPVLLGFGFPGLQSKVERELSFKARNSLLFTNPNYFDILHKFYVFRGDMKNAAASMYQLGQAYARFHRQGGSPFVDPSESFLELSKMQAQSYLAAMNDLALCQPEDAWFPDSSQEPFSTVSDGAMFGEEDSVDDGAQLDREPADAEEASHGREPDEEQLFINPVAAKRRRLARYIPEREFKVERAPIRFVCAEDVRREYHLVLARLHLVQFFPEASNPSFIMGPSNAVSLFVGNRQFDAAFDVARELEVDMSAIFQRLTTISVALTENLSRRRAATAATSADDGLVRRLDSVYDADEDRAELDVEFLSTSEWTTNWDGPAAERAWDYVRIHLEMYDGAASGWRYRQAVLDRCLALGATVPVPGWLVEWFEQHSPDALLRSYVEWGRVDEALCEGIRLVKDVSGVSGGCSVAVPYPLLDTALQLAEDPEERARRGASPSVLRSRDLAGELRTAVRQRFDALGKAEKSWIRELDRSERADMRV